MKKYIRPIVAAILLGAGFATMYAIPAKKGIRTFIQADGTTVEVELVGDEFAHIYVTSDGYPLVERGGNLYYADISADGSIEACNLKATSLQKRSAATKDFLKSVDKSLVPKALQLKAATSALKRKVSATSPEKMRAPKGPGLSPGSDFPTTGSPHVLVILAEFSDVPMTLNNAKDYFTRMMTERGFSDYGGTGSAIDYFEESSTGQFTPIIDVYGPVKLPQNRAYYGENKSNGEDKNPAQMIIDACEVLDSEIDFTKYDTDSDGTIDNVFVFYAGRGEADGGPSESVWPHSWYVLSGGNLRKRFDGVLLDRYACSNEYGNRRPDGVGTFIHEFSHVMGLPDLYPTSYSSAFTPGEWSALDYGPYNNNGCTPPLYSAFERYALGWIEPVLIDGPMTVALHPIGDNVCGIIKTEKDSEFFLIENRQQTSWDKYIPGHGMLIWHIDYNAYAWNSNTVNNTSSHQYVDIEEADGVKTAYTRAGDAFPGTSYVRSFTDDTTPSMKTWAGKSLGLPISDIFENNSGIISFNVAGGNSNSPVSTPTALAASEVEPTGFTANWAADEGSDYLLSVYKKDADGNKEYTKYNRTNVGAVFSAKVEGLETETEYYYTVTAIKGFNMSEASNEISVTTLRPGLESLAIEALPASNISDNRFTANWELLPEATSYLLSVYEFTMSDPMDFTTGFDDGELPSGWSSPGFTAVTLSIFCGKAIPSIAVAGGSYIETAVYGGINTLSFWHRATSSSTGTIAISAKIGEEWSVCKEFELKTSSPGITNNMTLPDGCSAVRIEFSGIGNLQIDDVTLNYVQNTVRKPVAPYDDYEVGNVNSYDVTGLTPGKDYIYVVRGSDGARQSKVSTEIRVRTQDVSGIASVGSDTGLKVSVSDGVLSVWGISDETAVAVSDISGRIVATGRGECSISLGRGVYIVRAGSASAKVML